MFAKQSECHQLISAYNQSKQKNNFRKVIMHSYFLSMVVRKSLFQEHIL